MDYFRLKYADYCTESYLLFCFEENFVSLAIFDLDNTLLAGDSDHLWGEFLVEQGVVDGDLYQRQNDEYYEQYKQGSLDIHEFLAFSLKPLSQHPVELLWQWRETFIEQKIRPIMLPKSEALLAKHKAQGDTLMIITATNDFVTGPIAEALGVDNLIATRAEFINNAYTGKVAGIPCFQHGKVDNLQSWLAENNETLQESWFYSDSANDIPLLDQVTYPVAVDADERLTRHAMQKNWPIMSLRD